MLRRFPRDKRVCGVRAATRTGLKLCNRVVVIFCALWGVCGCKELLVDDVPVTGVGVGVGGFGLCGLKDNMPNLRAVVGGPPSQSDHHTHQNAQRHGDENRPPNDVPTALGVGVAYACRAIGARLGGAVLVQRGVF